MAQTAASARAHYFNELLNNTRRYSFSDLQTKHGVKMIAAMILLVFYLTFLNLGGESSSEK